MSDSLSSSRPPPDASAEDGSICCCSHAGKCTCALKKEPNLDPVPETERRVEAKSGRRSLHKPRLSTAQSESALMVFANGHHKPGHKHNQTAQKYGAPYKIPRLHAIHGRSDMGRRSVDNLPAASSADGGLGTSPGRDSITSAQHDVRLVRSEHGSPHLSVSPELDHIRGQLPPLDLSFSNFNPSAGHPQPYEVSSWTPNSVDTYFCSTPDSERAVFSAGLEPPPGDWATFDSPVGSAGFRSPTHRHHASYSSLDWAHSGPAYAASTAASDNDDLAPFGIPSPLHPPSLIYNHFPSDVSEACESDSYRRSTSSSLHGLPQMSLLASGNVEGISIDEFLNRTATGGSFCGGDAVSEANTTTLVATSFAEQTKLGPTSAPAEDKRYSLPTPMEPPQSAWNPTLDAPPVRHSISPVGFAADHRVAETVWAN